jgi:hypothetical protein
MRAIVGPFAARLDKLARGDHCGMTDDSNRITLAARLYAPEAFAMPLDHGCRFDQHHGAEDLWPNPVKTDTEKPVGGDEPKVTRALPPQDGHLMSQGHELKLQGGAAANMERK